MTEFVTGIIDRLYSWCVFTCIVCIVIWCVVSEVKRGR
jgi:hypothetical protein